MKVILVGGGTGGSVFPLIAVAKKIPGAEFLFVGTKYGQEKNIVPYSFKAITCGKLRRYFSWANFLDLFKIKIGFFQALKIIWQFKPDVIFGAGSYVQVPVIWAGWFLGVPCIVHEQDIKPGLANKLVKPFVKKITKAAEIGNPVRDFVVVRNVQAHSLQLSSNKPVLLITGGGTGALAINKLVTPALCEFAQVIHLTGINKKVNNFSHPDYHVYEFLKEEMPEVLVRADLVVSRAGFSTLYELASLGKPTIIIPMPKTHQEENAKYFSSGAIVLNQNELTIEKFTKIIKKTLTSKDRLKQLGEDIKKIYKSDAAKKIAGEIRKFTS